MSSLNAVGQRLALIQARHQDRELNRHPMPPSIPGVASRRRHGVRAPCSSLSSKVVPAIACPRSCSSIACAMEQAPSSGQFRIIACSGVSEAIGRPRFGPTPSWMTGGRELLSILPCIDALSPAGSHGVCWCLVSHQCSGPESHLDPGAGPHRPEKPPIGDTNRAVHLLHAWVHNSMISLSRGHHGGY